MAESYGYLAQAKPTDTDIMTLYDPADAIDHIVNVTICNLTATDATFRISRYISAVDYFIVYDKVCPANNTLQISGIAMDGTEDLRCRVGTGSAIQFTVDGLTIS